MMGVQFWNGLHSHLVCGRIEVNSLPHLPVCLVPSNHDQYRGPMRTSCRLRPNAANSPGLSDESSY